MTNAELFKKVFGIYAEEFWAYPKDEMLNWLVYDVPDANVGDLISRQAAIDVVHHTIYEFFDVVEDDYESPLTYKDMKFLELNKSICSRIKDLTPADVVPKERYANLLANSIIVCEALKKYQSSDVVERKDLDKITEEHEKIGYEKGFRDGYAQANAVEAEETEEDWHKDEWRDEWDEREEDVEETD